MTNAWYFQESTYTPQVEAISPTLPSDPRDESPLRTTKDDLLKRIEKVDRDIAKVSEQGYKKEKMKSVQMICTTYLCVICQFKSRFIVMYKSDFCFKFC